MSQNGNFVDILKPRNTQFGIIKFMTRSWMPKKTMAFEKNYTPQELKDLVAKSVYMDSFLEAESIRQNVNKEQLRKEMLANLDEIAFEKKLHVVRWVGIVFLKICFMMKVGVFVNEAPILRLKESMGTKPVLFLPTHRSYADFCLMTYLCFHYDIDLPVVAAGMDFHSMAVVGQCMREMCAFYIRRTLIDAPVYAATLKHYVRTVVANHGAPFEFFIEGTRSRSNKSMPPRLGMLSMALMPYFAREVSDMVVVPVNISYDRLMELSLFAYEHLGVPKPKETTEGLLRSLQSLNDHFGNIYINVGSPISLNKYFKRDVFSEGTKQPVDLQAITADQFEMVQDLAHHVVAMHQDTTMVTISSLVSMVLMQSLMKNQPLHFDQVVEEVNWLADMFRNLGANVFESDTKREIERILIVHRKMFALDGERRLRLLISPPIVNAKAGTKASTLTPETMASAVPFIELQTNVNPVMHYLVPPAIVYMLVKAVVNNTDDCRNNYNIVRTILRHEFIYEDKTEDATFKKAFDYCLKYDVIAYDRDKLVVGGANKLQYLLQWVMLPSLTTVKHCMDVMAEDVRGVQQAVCGRVQRVGAAARGHPAALSLPAAALALRGLAAARALTRHRRGKEVEYEMNSSVLPKTRSLIEAILPNIHIEFGSANSVIMTRSPVTSRL